MIIFLSVLKFEPVNGLGSITPFGLAINWIGAEPLESSNCLGRAVFGEPIEHPHFLFDQVGHSGPTLIAYLFFLTKWVILSLMPNIKCPHPSYKMGL